MLKMQSELNTKRSIISNPSEKERIVVVNRLEPLTKKQILREDDYVELRDDTLVPGRFLKNEKYPQMVRPRQADI
jgi:hypothetical protein